MLSRLGLGLNQAMHLQTTGPEYGDKIIITAYSHLMDDNPGVDVRFTDIKIFHRVHGCSLSPDVKGLQAFAMSSGS